MTTATLALLLRKVEYRESDLMVTLFSEGLGKVTAVARSARRSRTRFAGSLEPLHTLSVELGTARQGDRFELRASRIERARLHLASDLERMNVAAKVLSWVRDATPERVAEPELYATLEHCLDALDDPKSQHSPRTLLALTGLSLLDALGWGLEFTQCVRCENPCPDGKAAYVSPSRGGVVCSACGGGAILLDSALRLRLARGGSDLPLGHEDGEVVLRLVEQTLAAHANVGRKP